MASRQSILREMAETNRWIREQQMARAYAFPIAFAPDGRLKETTPNIYMGVMSMYYKYNKSTEDLTLELRQERDGRDVKYATLGAVYSVDLHWNALETIRVHLIASRKHNNIATEHYNVFDMGAAGNAYTVPRQAWDNWCQWNQEKAEGCHYDKRLLFLALGDRSQIFNMTLEEFTMLTADRVEALQDRMVPGMMVIRPSIHEAFLDESPSNRTPPPVVEISSSSSSSEDSERKKEGSQGFNSGTLLGTSASQFKLGTMVGGFSRGGKRKSSARGSDYPGASKNLFQVRLPPLGPGFVHMGPDGPLTQRQIEGLNQVFEDCLKGYEPNQEVENDKEGSRRSMIPGPAPKAVDRSEVKPEEASPVLAERSGLKNETQSDKEDEEDDFYGGFDLSGVSSLDNISQMTSVCSSSTSNDMYGRWSDEIFNDSVEVFLAKQVNESKVVNVSTDDSILEVSKGQVSDSSQMDL